MDKQEQERLILGFKTALRDRKLVCGICGGDRWDMVGSYHKMALDDKLDAGLIIGGNYIPVTIVICLSCGYMLLMSSKFLDRIADNIKSQEINKSVPEQKPTMSTWPFPNVN